MFKALQERQRGRLGGPTGFQRRASAASELVERLELQRQLSGHDGCVNTVAFTPDGQRLISGSDDHNISFWNWETGDTVFPLLFSCFSYSVNIQGI